MRSDIVNVPKRRFSVEEYYRLVEVGILGPADKVELIHGEIVKMSPVGPRHAGLVNRLNRLLLQLLDERYIISPQNPVRLSFYSEPEPDMAVLYFRDDYYGTQHPEPKDVALLIEVSGSTLEYDSLVKLPLYAKKGIPEYWIIDLQNDRILIHTDPDGTAYQSKSIYQRGEVLSSSVLSNDLSVDEILD